jgi:hypothetical protein
MRLPAVPFSTTLQSAGVDVRVFRPKARLQFEGDGKGGERFEEALATSERLTP